MIIILYFSLFFKFRTFPVRVATITFNPVKLFTYSQHKGKILTENVNILNHQSIGMKTAQKPPGTSGCSSATSLQEALRWQHHSWLDWHQLRSVMHCRLRCVHYGRLYRSDLYMIWLSTADEASHPGTWGLLVLLLLLLRSLHPLLRLSPLIAQTDR